eukprot:85255-Pelagomonas_calceolata.AAC.1
MVVAESWLFGLVIQLEVIVAGGLHRALFLENSVSGFDKRRAQTLLLSAQGRENDSVNRQSFGRDLVGGRQLATS